MRQRRHPRAGRTSRTGSARWALGLLLALLLTAMTTAVQPLTAAANDPGDSFHTRASSDEFLAYSCIIRLQHSGAANGTLIGTFEHAAKDGTVRDQAGTASWRHLTVTGSG